MKRAILAALAAACLFPWTLQAQGLDFDRPSWGPRVRLTPFVGFAPAVTRTERWRFQSPGFSANQIFEVGLAPGYAAGATAELQLIDRFALIGSALWMTRGKTVERTDASPDQFRHPGSNFLFAKAALALRLREQTSDIQLHSLTGTIFVGPAMIRETPKPDPNVPHPVLLEPLNYTGLNFGLDLQMPLLTPWMTFQAGVEDYFFRWADVEMARRNDVAAGGSLQSAVETNPAHIFLFRAGFSLQVR